MPTTERASTPTGDLFDRWSLRDGTRLALRTLRPQDAAGLGAMIGSLGTTSRRREVVPRLPIIAPRPAASCGRRVRRASRVPSRSDQRSNRSPVGVDARSVVGMVIPLVRTGARRVTFQAL